MRALICLLLLPALAQGQAADLTLKREPGPAGKFKIKLASRSQHESVVINAVYKAAWKAGGVASFESVDFEMVAGDAPAGLQPFTDLEMKTSEHGLPIDPDIAGMNLVYALHQACGYLPNKRIEPEHRFGIDHKAGSSSLVGEGRFLGWEDDGKLARIKLDAVYDPVPGMPKVELKLDAWFDPALGRVVRARGVAASLEMRKGSLSRTEMELELEEQPPA